MMPHSVENVDRKAGRGDLHDFCLHTCVYIVPQKSAINITS